MLNLSFTGKSKELELLKIKHPNGQITHQKVTPGIIKLQLPQQGIYQLSVALLRGAILTIERVEKLTPPEIDIPNWSINNQQIIFQSNDLKGEQFETKSDYPLFYYKGSTKRQGKETIFNFKDEMIATIPYLWTIRLQKLNKKISLDFQKLLFFYKTQAELMKVDTLLYQGVLKEIEEANQRQLLTFMRGYPNMLPKRFLGI